MDEKLSERYQHLKEKVETRKAEFAALMSFIEKETEYLQAPASTKYHLSQESGLLEHSIHVAETMLQLRQVLAPDIPEESCVIVGLLHDLGKVGMPGKSQYIKNEHTDGKWKQPYFFNRKLTYLSVTVRSIYLISRYFPFTEEEVQAIAYHDGQYVEDNRSVAGNECPLTLLAQYADSWSAFVIEKEP